MATGTNKPVGSTDPRDLLANAGNLDEAVNDPLSLEWTDRKGNKRKTWRAIEMSAPIAVNAAEAAIAAEQSIAARTAQITTDATLAAVGAVTTQVESARDVAVAAKDGAELARDAAIAAAGPLYATIEEGRAAVADGETFAVQGSGLVAASIYRRINAATSVLISELSSAQQGAVVMSESAAAGRSAVFTDFLSAGYIPPQITIDADGRYMPGSMSLDFFSGVSQPAAIRLSSEGRIYGGFALDFVSASDAEEVVRTDMGGKRLPQSGVAKVSSTEGSAPFWQFGLQHEGIDLDSRYTSDLLTTQAQLYDWYDALVAESGGLLSSAVLGNSQSGEEIREYTLLPPPIHTEGDTPLPAQKVLLIVGGVHGNEKNGMVCAYLYLRRLLRDWRSSAALAEIKHNVIVKVIPVANPWGLNNNRRQNSRNVDLNRNFDADWAAGGSANPANDRYRGEAPFSEAESRVLRDAVSRPGITAVIDSHTHIEPTYAVWLGSEQEVSLRIAQRAAAVLQAWMRTNAGVSDATQLIRISGNGAGTFARWTQVGAAVPCVLNETYAETTNSTLLPRSLAIYRRIGALGIESLATGLLEI